MNLSPDGSSNNIQRRLYITFQASYYNKSPNRLPIYVLIYGLKNASKNDIDISIYDWEKAYEVSFNEQFTMHMPINMNGVDILKTSHYLHGYLITNLSHKTFIINGSKRVLLPSGSIIKQIQIIYNSFKSNYKKTKHSNLLWVSISIKRFFHIRSEYTKADV